jgi:hypothetical protein
MIQELGYHNVFNELHIDMADRLEGVDPEHIARDHLNAYGYQRDQTFEGIKHFIDAYNRRVTHFIEYFNEFTWAALCSWTRFPGRFHKFLYNLQIVIIQSLMKFAAN